MKTSLAKAVASTIASVRKRTGLSQEALANRSGLDRTYISGIERGVRNITLNSLEKVINGLEIDTADFFEEVMRELKVHDKAK